MQLAFIGLGRMGSGMARNLLRAGHGVTVYNRTREKTKALEADGAAVADSPAAACRQAEAAITMLSDDDAVAEVVFGESGVARALGRNAAHISSSTISTRMARLLATRHAEAGQGYLSAPVFGRPEAAEQKKLVVIAAGPEDLVARFRPLFEAVGRETVVAGREPWQANAVKLCGNFMIAAMLESFGEAYAALRKARIDPHVFGHAMDALFASPVYANYGRIVAEERFEPAGFQLKLGLKDMRLALENARECAAPMPLASLLHDHFLAALANGQGEMDWSSIARVAARNAGL
ncbi:MAG: NAD(P)-dependent oxidoreductase [Acidobacteriia bacterium]|nr:NAD(P)-dependent oxidoreductase [Terriglobia bacterium]